MAARSEAPNDPRPYIRVALDLPMNPKLAAIEENFHACGWAYICSLCYCGQSLTDGHFPMRAVLRMADVTRNDVMALVEQGLWHLPDHGCPTCEQPKPGHVVIHDYLQHQRSAAEVHDLSAKRREAGRKGAEKRWSPPKQSTGSQAEQPAVMASAIASAMANGQQELWQMDGKAIAEEMRGDEMREQTPSGSEEATPPTPKPPKSRLITSRAARMPDEWAVSIEMIEWAREATPNVGQMATEMFRDHFSGAPGDKGIKKDWDATWRNWMRREQAKFDEQQERADRQVNRNVQGRRRQQETYHDPKDLDDYDQPFYAAGA